MLDNEQFLTVVELTPLVAVDLILQNENDQVLLGKRVNRPAQGFWFVPGGRIWKGERIQEAMKRISRTELGVVIEQATLLGVFDHLYDDNFLGKPGVSTHYVSLGYGCSLEAGTALEPDKQHGEFRWWGVEELLASPEVHENTKRYFAPPIAGNSGRTISLGG